MSALNIEVVTMAFIPHVALTPVATAINPSEIAVPWDNAGEALLLVAIIAAIVERSLSLIYESSWYIRYQENLNMLGRSNKKAGIAFALSTIVAYLYQIDILAIITSKSEVSAVGIILTGSLIAGGSKASVALFRDFLDIKSSSRKLYESGIAQPSPRNSALAAKGKQTSYSQGSSRAGTPVNPPPK